MISDEWQLKIVDCLGLTIRQTAFHGLWEEAESSLHFQGKRVFPSNYVEGVCSVVTTAM